MRILGSIILFLLIYSCQAQVPDLVVGGPCEGCEALLEYDDQPLNASDTLAHFSTTSAPLILKGVVYHADGKTPAQDIIIYAYHTDEQGIYITHDESEGWERRHGYLRGWVKTGPNGEYSFYTNRPATYPDTSIPQHIHLTIKEPGMIPYYIDAVHFLDDPFLTVNEKSSFENRGGSGLVDPDKSTGTWTIQRNITLGLNIPGHPDN